MASPARDFSAGGLAKTEESIGDAIGLSAESSAKVDRYKLLQKIGEGGCGKSEKAAALSEAMRLLDGLSDEAKTLQEVSRLIRLVAAERSKG